MKKRTRGRPKNPNPVETGVVGFRLPLVERNRLDALLLERQHKRLPLASKQDLFEWLVGRLLSGRQALPKRLSKTEAA